MIRTLIFLSFFLLTNISICQDSSFFKINFNSVSTVEIKFQNFCDTVLFKSGFYNFFPNTYIVDNGIKLYGDGVYFANFKIQLPQKVNLYFGEVSSDFETDNSNDSHPQFSFTTICFLVPFDTLIIEIDYSRRNNPNKLIRFLGKTAMITEYYLEKQIYFDGINLLLQKGILSNISNNLESFVSTLDSLTNIELQYFDTYTSKINLPLWFQSYENADLKYFAIGLKLKQPDVMEYLSGTVPTMPEDYFSFANNHEFNDKDAILSIYFFLSLRNYFFHYSKRLNVRRMAAKTDSFEFATDFVEYATANYSSYISDILLARELDMKIERDRVKELDYRLLYNNVQDANLRKYLKDRYEHKKSLTRGDKAPSFYLKNANNEYISLKSFKGNVVYISFWFTGCKPCLKEFPKENQLVESFKFEKVKIISICMNSNEENWKQVLAKYQLKTVNLFANKNWGRILKDGYDINSYPHYVLIDEEGKIIENKCNRPSQGIEQTIIEILKTK